MAIRTYIPITVKGSSVPARNGLKTLPMLWPECTGLLRHRKENQCILVKTSIRFQPVSCWKNHLSFMQQPVEKPPIHSCILWPCLFIIVYVCICISHVPPHSSLSTSQPDLSSWRCPQWQHHTDLAPPSAPQWCCSVLSSEVVIVSFWLLCGHNKHHNSAFWPDPWYPVHFRSEGLHCGLWTLQWSAHPTHCWWWGHAVLFVTGECPPVLAL